VIITGVKIQVEVFWVVTPCSVVVGYQHFGGPCCLHLQEERWHPTTTLHGVIPQKDLDLTYQLLREIKYGADGQTEGLWDMVYTKQVSLAVRM
jgi:hypothetical protein